MVSRRVGWRIIALAAACIAAASASLAGATDFGTPTPPADVPFATTGSVAPTRGRLVWGGVVPPAPVPGEATVYVPSAAYSAERPAGSGNSMLLPPVEPARRAEPVARDTVPVAEDIMPAGEEPMPAGEPETSSAGDAEPIEAAEPPPVEEPARAARPGRLPPIDGGYEEPAGDVELLREEASLPPPLGEPEVIDDGEPAGGEYGALPEESFDPWEGLTDVTPGAVPPPAIAVVPSYASLERRSPARQFGEPRHGALEAETPTGYQRMPQSEAQCRRELKKLGVKFVDVTGIASSRSCGIQNPVKVSMAVDGIAMQPAATLNCHTALQVARWLKEDVKSAARWKLWKRPTALINASSYRCSRIAGSATVSEHASGSALDVRGFRFADGSKILVEKKGFFSPREGRFLTEVRKDGCKYFGTVLGPGYNRAHADHLHLDVKARLRPVCK